MAFTLVFSNGEPRDYGAFDSYEITDAGVLIIQMHREDVERHYVAPGRLEVSHARRKVQGVGVGVTGY